MSRPKTKNIRETEESGEIEGEIHVGNVFTELMKTVSSKSRLNSRLQLIIFVTMFFIILFTMMDYFTDIQHKVIRKNMKQSTVKQEDYSRLININFSFIHLPLICQHGHPLFVVLVHSAPENIGKRKIIRETWGSKGNNIRVVFMLGCSEDETIQNSIAQEFEANKDIVQGNFSDSYHNLTYKHVMVLKYAVYHCPEARYVVKLDDDVFVNMPNMKEFIHLYNMDYANSTDILCSRMYGNPVLRSGRWGVAIEEYPEDTYPNHCSGFAIIYPQSASSSLYAQAQKTKYFWIDDVHVSGTLAKSANLTHKGIENLILSNEDVVGIVDFNVTDITKPFLFGTMNLNGYQIRSLWDFVKQHTPKASILDFLE